MAHQYDSCGGPVSKKTGKKPEQVELVPEEQFEEALKKVLSTSKEESDLQLARFQALNKARRQTRKHKP